MEASEPFVFVTDKIGELSLLVVISKYLAKVCLQINSY